MESISREDYAQVASLVEVTSDAVALCEADGTILHVNRQLLKILGVERSAIVGQDIKDILYTARFERTTGRTMPFTLDGSDCTLMCKLPEGSFIPVSVRAISRTGGKGEDPEGLRGRMLVAWNSLEEQFAHDRSQQRLLHELEASNKRLSGTLSIIMATMGSDDLPALMDIVLNRSTDALDARGATIYFAENGGFKLRGVSKGLEEEGVYVPDFIPYGAGVPTHVKREGRACRVSVVSATESGSRMGVFYDLDTRRSRKLRLEETPPFKTLISVPVYYGTQLLGVMELGWSRPCLPREYDINVLEVVSEYLSFELMGMLSSRRASRIAELERSLNHVRDILFAHVDSYAGLWGDLSSELRRTLDCHVCPVLHDRRRNCYAIDYEGVAKVDLPMSVEEAFFSTTAPATRVGPLSGDAFVQPASFSGAEPKKVRLVRVDRSSTAGRWLARHGLPCQGVFIDAGPDVLPLGVDGVEGDEADASSVAATTALASREDARPNRMILLLRSSSQEPINDLEFDYLSHMACDVEAMAGNERKRETEHRIAQALQSGMRSTLGSVPGITTDSLYLSATSQALVGGDLYTLIRLPDDQAVMILGDVSGKGIEAASMSSFVKTALSAYAWEGFDPARMAASLNSMLLDFSSPETFVTAFIAKIDLRLGSFTYCSAGHPPAMLARTMTGGSDVELMGVQCGVIGAFESMRYENGTMSFRPGDILFMYTDGAIEARSPEGDFFGEDRLRNVVKQAADIGIDGLCEHVLDQLDAFTNSALDDDIALVALRFDRCGREGGGEDGED